MLVHLICYCMSLSLTWLKNRMHCSTNWCLEPWKWSCSHTFYTCLYMMNCFYWALMLRCLAKSVWWGGVIAKLNLRQQSKGESFKSWLLSNDANKNFPFESLKVYISEMGQAVMSTSYSAAKYLLPDNTCVQFLTGNAFVRADFLIQRPPAACSAVWGSAFLEENFWLCIHIITVNALRSCHSLAPVCLLMSVCEPAGVVAGLALLVIGVPVSTQLEMWVLRLCPQFTTADCSSGWLGFSAKTGITDPCLLPTFTADFSMCTQLELQKLRELKKCISVCEQLLIIVLFSMFFKKIPSTLLPLKATWESSF